VLASLTVGGYANKKSAKSIVMLYNSSQQNLGTKLPLIFLNDRPFSALFYSKGQAMNKKTLSEIDILAKKSPVYIAVRRNQLGLIAGEQAHLKNIGKTERYDLFLRQASN
jgi:hypothetical protein